jgi:hypothetical protein
MPSPLIAAVKVALSHAHRQGPPAPQTVLQTVSAMAPILGNARQLARDALADLTPAPNALDTLAATSITALLALAPSTAEPHSEEADTVSALCAALWDTIARHIPRKTSSSALLCVPRGCIRTVAAR